MTSKILQYQPFSSFVDPGFWYKLVQIKLDIDKLSENRKQIHGYTAYHDKLTNLFEVTSTAFNISPENRKVTSIYLGALYNKNTIEDFKECNKVDLLNEEGTLLWQDMQAGTCIDNPLLLSRFVILSYADLKKYNFYYWFAFPSPSHPVVHLVDEPLPLSSVFDQEQIESLIESCYELDSKQKSYFYISVNNQIVKAQPLSYAINSGIQNDFKNLVDRDKLCFGYMDSSNNECPGWMLRNLIALLSYHCPSIRGRTAWFVSIRLEQNGNYDKSLVFNISFPQDLEGDWGKDWVGWERNDKGKFGPRYVNMSSTMDPVMLAESSVDLNLKLMKWRLLPDLDLDIIKETKCLLLGAGTLGCCVARNLLAWGVRHITFVDNGKVSYSNPVRQNLFTHEDCLQGGKFKALAAADNLKKIFMGVKSGGIILHIPMPGHTVGESLMEQTVKDIETLTQLISTHDVIFMLLDSREARWLPTLLASHFKKLSINAALGFDSYLVMRHGISEGSEVSLSDSPQQDVTSHYIPGHQLGCYFCNDITAPGNSQADRTLDQQCTVTRPGVSNIAGALAVEMAIAITQHRERTNAPAPYNLNSSTNLPEEIDYEGVLGAIPHSIRGFLTSYQHVLPSSGKFRQCIACSSIVIDMYRTKGLEFILEVLKSTKYLEDITGLTHLHAEAATAEVWALSDSEEED